MTLILLFHALSNGTNYFKLAPLEKISLLYLYNIILFNKYTFTAQCKHSRLLYICYYHIIKLI